jgi:uncharacterized protein YhbP (UPF0306 family)
VTVRVVRSPRRVANTRLARVARRLLGAAPLCALATVTPGGRAYVNTMYFARSDPWDLVWISSPDSQHSRNLRQSGTAAIAVFDSHQRWGGTDRGIQVFGRARELRGAAARAALKAYSERFKPDEAILGRYVAYRLRPARLKLFDEREFGSGTFVMARVGRDGRLVWQRTEEYRDDRGGH